MPITRVRTSSATRPTGAPRSTTTQRLTVARNTFTLVPKCTFLNLPNELICEILALLPAHDLAACRRTCRTLHTVITKTHRLALCLSLARHQLEPTFPPSSIPAATQLKALDSRVDNWTRLKWRATKSVAMPDAGAIYEFVGGVYCNARAGPDERRVNGEIRFYQLPDAFGENGSGSGRSGVNDVRQWKVDVSDMVVLDFTVDPGQDLAVLVAIAEEPTDGRRYELHFRTLSSDESHPLASASVRICGFIPGEQTMESSTTFRILVMGPILLLLVKDVMHPEISHLSLHNWQAGPDAIYTFPLRMMIEDVVFLSATEFLILTPNGAFDVYAFAQPTPAVPIGKPTLLRRFEMPRLKPLHRYWYATATANPLPGSRPYDRSPYTSSPFAPSASTSRTASDSPHEPESPFVEAPICELSQPATPTETPSESESTPATTSFSYFHNPHSRVGSVRPPPFSSRADDGLLAIAIGTLSPAPENHMSCFVLFVRIAKLLALARSQPADLPPPAAGTRAARKRKEMVKLGASPASLTPSLPSSLTHTSLSPSRRASAKDGIPAWKRMAWREWGPPTTRLFHDLLSSDWQHAVHGFRTAERVLPDDVALRALLRGRPPPPVHPVRHCVRVRDFNPSLFVGNDGAGCATDEGWVFAPDSAPYRIVRSPSRILAETSETFAEDVESCLPYREAVSEETFSVSDIMMDDARVLCLRRGPEGRLVGFDVRTF